MRRMARATQTQQALTERFVAGNVRGSAVRARLDWVRDHRDRAEVIEFFESLPPAMRSVVAASWYPFEDLIEVDRLILARFGNGDLRFLEDVGAYAARQSLGAMNRYLPSSGVHEFFRRSVELRRESQDFGKTRYENVDDTGGRMIHEKDASYSPLHCATATGFYRESIRLHGATDVQVWESQCQCRGDASCTFELRWS